MAVYARGYRRFKGHLGPPRAAWTIFREGYRTAFRSRGFRLIGILFILWFAVWGIVLYIRVNLEHKAASTGAQDLVTQVLGSSLVALNDTLAAFYGGVAALTALLGLLVGSGLVSDDLRTRALPLYLVRPIQPIDYVLGKALIVPGILAWMALLPGLAFFLLTALWQPPGESIAFLRDNVEIVWTVGKHFLIAAGAYTGLMLLLSSRTPRRGIVASIAAAVIFGGSMLQGMSQRIEGTAGDLMRLAGLPLDSFAEFVRRSARSPRDLERMDRGLPSSEGALIVAGLLLLVGIIAAWRRASSVEVTG